ncbi:hypothetical protein NMY22_g16084 [Coprinellus aureogranulatus]|nr:hypothetical protein NMY22_g16084 [Coprinellus aureogranulatus]
MVYAANMAIMGAHAADSDLDLMGDRQGKGRAGPISYGGAHGDVLPGVAAFALFHLTHANSVSSLPSPSPPFIFRNPVSSTSPSPLPLRFVESLGKTRRTSAIERCTHFRGGYDNDTNALWIPRLSPATTRSSHRPSAHPSVSFIPSHSVHLSIHPARSSIRLLIHFAYHPIHPIDSSLNLNSSTAHFFFNVDGAFPSPLLDDKDVTCPYSLHSEALGFSILHIADARAPAKIRSSQEMRTPSLY